MGRRNFGGWSIQYNDRYLCWTICHGGLLELKVEEVAKSFAYQNSGYSANLFGGFLWEHWRLVGHEWSSELSDVITTAIRINPNHCLFLFSQNYGRICQWSMLTNIFLVLVTSSHSYQHLFRLPICHGTGIRLVVFCLILSSLGGILHHFLCISHIGYGRTHGSNCPLALTFKDIDCKLLCTRVISSLRQRRKYLTTLNAITM